MIGDVLFSAIVVNSRETHIFAAERAPYVPLGG
jgi:hypothetical protein